jgi:hypothetical protein
VLGVPIPIRIVPARLMTVGAEVALEVVAEVLAVSEGVIDLIA